MNYEVVVYHGIFRSVISDLNDLKDLAEYLDKMASIRLVAIRQEYDLPDKEQLDTFLENGKNIFPKNFGFDIRFSSSPNNRYRFTFYLDQDKKVSSESIEAVERNFPDFTYKENSLSFFCTFDSLDKEVLERIRHFLLFISLSRINLQRCVLCVIANEESERIVKEKMDLVRGMAGEGAEIGLIYTQRIPWLDYLGEFEAITYYSFEKARKVVP